MITTYLTYFLSFVVVISAIAMVVQRNPVYCAASLIVVMLSLAIHYLLLNAEFIAAIQVIVYTGAIMGLFVFVIMILNVNHAFVIGRLEWTPGRIWGTVLGLVFLVQLALIAFSSVKVVTENDKFIAQFKNLDSTRLIGKVLFSDFLLPFELVSVVLIVGVIGAVILAKREA